jgi:hypothetical protein
MHLGEFIASLFYHFWPPPFRGTANDTSSRLSAWASWGLFVINFVVVLFLGYAFLFR